VFVIFIADSGGVESNAWGSYKRGPGKWGYGQTLERTAPVRTN
jgi:hypothetical protein